MAKEMTDAERIASLEQEVKNLTRLVKETIASQRVTTNLAKMISRDQSNTDKAVKDLAMKTNATTSTVTQLQSQVQRLR